MTDCTDVQALEKISTEVDESQIKITLSSQCIKAQAYLVDKLRKQSERQKEICVFISNSNLKLEAEIKQAEHEINSLTVAHETIRSSNVELKKELLLAKENKSEIEERVKTGEKKYEDLWLESKARYESLPIVQVLLETRNKGQTFQENINTLHNQAQKLINEIETKKREYLNLDKKRVVELANFFVNEVPKTINMIKEKTEAISVLEKEIVEMMKEKEVIGNEELLSTAQVRQRALTPEKQIIAVDDNWPNLYANANDSLPMPKLQFDSKDFDALSATLDQIKIKKVEILQTTPLKRTDSKAEGDISASKRAKKSEEHIPYLFNTPVKDNENCKQGNFSNRKLINILEDVKLDKNDAYKIISNLTIDNLKDVNTIGVDISRNEERKNIPIESEEIEEIDLTNTNNYENLVPPTQFLDYSQEKNLNSQQPADVLVHISMIESSSENVNNSLKDAEYLKRGRAECQTGEVPPPHRRAQPNNIPWRHRPLTKNSQEGVKKKVSFDLPTATQITEVDDVDVEMDVNKTASSELNVSAVSDEGYARIKDMILKKHNLDSSPQFVYAANTTLVKTRNDDKAVTSKFFTQNISTLDIENNEADKNVAPQDSAAENIDQQTEAQDANLKDNFCEDENVAISSPKIKEIQKVERPVTGFLFNHGTQGIPDSLNVSLSTTGFEEGEPDYPHCIDSSLLLSPKADVPMTAGNADLLSQEVPNFLSGLRKTGLSLFGISTNSEANVETNPQNSSNSFNFNFGGEEKKNRGGLFSMFR